MKVSNKIIVVTGSGIGRALSLHLLRKQAKVVGGYKSELPIRNAKNCRCK
jgi:NAD(P)-dependent dehydrogenase (short-subunit alcohol dehydrogenase family)